MAKKTRKPTAPKVTVRIPTTKAAKAKAEREIPTDAIEKMKRWNAAHPDQPFSWVIVKATLPAAQRVCRTCKKEFREGRVTRVDATGAYCGPRCQTKAAGAAKSSK